MIRVASRTSTSADSFFNVAPTGNDAYEIAKDYIRPTLKSPAEFATEGFEFGKDSESVFVVKSYFETKSDESYRYQNYFYR